MKRIEAVPHRFTSDGRAIHLKTHDHLPSGSPYARLNKRVAVAINKYVMTMTAFWVFCFISLLSLPAVLTGVVPSLANFFPHWLVKASLVALVAWISSNFLQLVFLPALGVGQNLQSEVSDLRAQHTYEDMVKVLDMLDTSTEGGLAEVLKKIDEMKPRTRKVTP